MTYVMHRKNKLFSPNVTNKIVEEQGFELGLLTLKLILITYHSSY